MHPTKYEDARNSALFTDLYEVTMAQAYAAEQMRDEAVFELFFRRLPKGRGYVMAAGLDDVLTYLENFRFTDDDLEYLQSQGTFSNEFLDELRELRFTGDVYAVPEGTVVFPNEPLVQVVAPMLQAQWIETLVLNQIHFQSVLATKAARVVTAAQGRNVVDFGSRRAHGAEAALAVARCSYLAGAGGTSNVLAGQQYGIPIFGTMAHSYVQAHDEETAAFEAFARLYPNTTLLVDTYDTLAGVRRAIAMRQRLGEDFHFGAIRLDSGDLGQLARQSRKMLDDAGLSDVKIFVSSSLDEYEIERLLDEGSPIDGFGVGTKMAVSKDAPALDMAYKLVEFAGRGRMKLSSEKVIYPGRKQVFRRREGEKFAGDVIAAHDETIDGESLLQPVMQSGRRLPEAERTLDQMREHARRQLAALPAPLKALRVEAEAPDFVRISDRLQQAESELHDALEKKH